jgi:hypothetical protein
LDCCDLLKITGSSIFFLKVGNSLSGFPKNKLIFKKNSFDFEFLKEPKSVIKTKTQKTGTIFRKTAKFDFEKLNRLNIVFCGFSRNRSGLFKIWYFESITVL